MAVATGIPMSEWEAAGERAIVTALDELDRQAKPEE